MAMKMLSEYNAPYCERDYGKSESEIPVSMRCESTMEVAAPIFLAGAKTMPGLTGEESVKFEMTANLALSTIMGRSTPLYSQLYSEGLINETFGYDFENDCGVSCVSFGGESKNPEQVCLRVLDEAARLAAKGIDEKFFERRVKAAYGSAIRSLNSFDNICYNVAVASFNGYDYFNTASVIESITTEDVRNFIAKYLIPEKTAISIIHSKD
jgi:predicted Zn-dependent peptidase